jgi:hypothetical protein
LGCGRRAVVTDRFTVAMGLTLGWGAAFGLGCVLVARRRNELPDGFAPGRPASVVIWCRAFSVAFAAARPA